MSEYFEPFFSKVHCSFRKSSSAQQCLLSMFEKWKLAADNPKKIGSLLPNVSKAFDCVSHDF